MSARLRLELPEVTESGEDAGDCDEAFVRTASEPGGERGGVCTGGWETLNRSRLIGEGGWPRRRFGGFRCEGGRDRKGDHRGRADRGYSRGLGCRLFRERCPTGGCDGRHGRI